MKYKGILVIYISLKHKAPIYPNLIHIQLYKIGIFYKKRESKVFSNLLTHHEIQKG